MKPLNVTHLAKQENNEAVNRRELRAEHYRMLVAEAVSRLGSSQADVETLKQLAALLMA